MPLDPTDSWYKRESTPISITALGVALRNYFHVGSDAFGTKGNLAHTSGYHRSRNWVLNSPDSRWGSSDYSVRDGRDKSGGGDWISAFDLTPAEWGTPRNRRLMVEITRNVRAAARNRDPRLATLREFAGTEDGVHVVTFNCADGSAKSPFDSSHLDHGHGSFWRSLASRSHAGVFEVMTGGAPMPSEWHTGEPNGSTLTQGTPGYAGQQRDTALAFAWQASAEAAAGVQQLLAAAAADETRDTAALAAIQALTALVQQGGGNVSNAPILAAIESAGQRTHDLVVQLQEQVAEVHARNVKLAQALAAAGGALDGADD